jgi:hypothetical protein
LILYVVQGPNENKLGCTYRDLGLRVTCYGAEYHGEVAVVEERVGQHVTDEPVFALKHLLQVFKGILHLLHAMVQLLITLDPRLVRLIKIYHFVPQLASQVSEVATQRDLCKHRIDPMVIQLEDGEGYYADSIADHHLGMVVEAEGLSEEGEVVEPRVKEELNRITIQLEGKGLKECDVNVHKLFIAKV